MDNDSKYWLNENQFNDFTSTLGNNAYLNIYFVELFLVLLMCVANDDDGMKINSTQFWLICLWVWVCVMPMRNKIKSLVCIFGNCAFLLDYQIWLQNNYVFNTIIHLHMCNTYTYTHNRTKQNKIWCICVPDSISQFYYLWTHKIMHAFLMNP